MKIEELEKMYSGQSIDALETVAKAAQKLSEDSHAEMIRILFYLERSKRYKESPIYKYSTFKKYLADRFDMAYSSYAASKAVYVSMPEEAASFGPGLVKRAVRSCGVTGAKSVLSEIKAKNANRATPIPAEEVEKRIVTFAARVNPKPKESGVPKCELERQNAMLREENAMLRKEIEERDRRIEALLQTVAAFRDDDSAFHGLDDPRDDPRYVPACAY